MWDTPEALLDRIRLGEDSLLECKAVVLAGDKVRGPARDDLADEMAAFANPSGGVLVLGIEDGSRAVEGIPESGVDTVERFVTEGCQDSIRPPLLPRIQRVRRLTSAAYVDG